ncbi:MAG: PqqD family protein [Alistipes sp.]|nr:PqqD family protein [Alistipes sp.]
MKIDSKVKVRNIAGENVVIMQGRLGADLTRIIQLNGSSQWLLEQLTEREFEVADVVALLTSRYDVDEQTATADAQKWVEQLREHKMITE